MKRIYGPALREQVRQRMSPPNRESVAEIARSTGIAVPTIYSWRHQWQKEGKLVPASGKAPEQWSADDKLAAVIQAAALSGTDLGSLCRQRGLYPKQLAGWRPIQDYEQAFLLNPQRWTQGPRDLSQPKVEKSTILDQCNLQLLEPNKPRPPRLSDDSPTERHW
jgi:transposase-like protein